MNFRRIIIIFSIVSIVLVISLLGFSYAWYVASNVSTNINVNTPSSEVIKVDFEVGNYIHNTTGVPILDSESSTKADKNSFTIIAKDTMTRSANYNIYIDEIVMEELLKSPDFKWQLLKNNVSVATGNFANIGENTRINLYTTDLTLNALTPDSYELRMWLSETGQNQNALMGKTFSGRIKVDTYLTR